MDQWDLRLSPLLELIERDNNSEWRRRDRSYLYFHQMPDGLDIFVSSFCTWYVLIIKHFARTHDLISGFILHGEKCSHGVLQTLFRYKRLCLLSKQGKLFIVYSKLYGLLYSCTYLCQLDRAEKMWVKISDLNAVYNIVKTTEPYDNGTRKSSLPPNLSREMRARHLHTGGGGGGGGGGARGRPGRGGGGGARGGGAAAMA